MAYSQSIVLYRIILPHFMTYGQLLTTAYCLLPIASCLSLSPKIIKRNILLGHAEENIAFDDFGG